MITASVPKPVLRATYKLKRVANGCEAVADFTSEDRWLGGATLGGYNRATCVRAVEHEALMRAQTRGMLVEFVREGEPID